jgi:hypothetical protein
MRRAEILQLKERPRVRGLCSERDWEELERRLADGEEPSRAARSFGRTLTDFRKTDYYRHQRVLALSREARADVADRTLDEWAHAPDASDTIRVYWHRYCANAAGRGVERHELLVSGPQVHAEDRSASLADVAEVLKASGALLELAPGPERGEPAGVEVAGAGAAVAASADGEREAGGVP